MSNKPQSTSNYEQFKMIVSNREVDERHVHKLMVAIRKKNLLHINPILVNRHLEVIDGQHRLEAAKRLNLMVHYVVDDAISKADIAAINTNQKNWSTMDYINYWTIEKAVGFDKLSSFLASHPLIPPTTALMMLSPETQGFMPSLKAGKVDVSNYDHACKIAEIIKEYRNLIDHAYERNFILAVIAMVNTPGYDHSIMKDKLEYQSRSLVRCISKKQYVELLEEIYNYRSSKNLIKIA